MSPALMTPRRSSRVAAKTPAANHQIATPATTKSAVSSSARSSWTVKPQAAKLKAFMASRSRLVLAVIFMLLAGLSLQAMPGSLKACDACSSATVLDSLAGAAVSYSGKTFLVADAAAAQAFIADPAAALPLSVKATLYPTTAFWSAEPASLCRC